MFPSATHGLVSGRAHLAPGFTGLSGTPTKHLMSADQPSHSGLSLDTRDRKRGAGETQKYIDGPVSSSAEICSKVVIGASGAKIHFVDYILRFNITRRGQLSNDLHTHNATSHRSKP